jgi:hypothetical protein
LRVWRRAVAPTREVLSAMARADVSDAQGDTHIFLRDCHDHTVQLMEALDLGFIAWYRFFVPRAGLANAAMWPTTQVSQREIHPRAEASDLGLALVAKVSQRWLDPGPMSTTCALALLRWTELIELCERAYLQAPADRVQVLHSRDERPLQILHSRVDSRWRLGRNNAE